MGIQNRDYFRQSNSSGGMGDWGFSHWTPVVKYLIAANIVVFLLQVFVVREVRPSPLEGLRKQIPALDKFLTERGDDPEALEEFRKEHPKIDQRLRESEEDEDLSPGQRVSVVQEWFELDTGKVLHGQVWRLITHAFCHDRSGLFHILFNMLFLYWFGCTLESMYGPREFLLFYLTAAVVAGLAFVGLDLYTGSRVPAIGASGAVMAVTMLYAMHFPREPIWIFWFFRVEMRWLIIFYVIYDLHPVLLALAGDRFFSGVAHSAHLGGLGFGFLYARYQWRLEPLTEWLPGLRWRWKASRRGLRIAAHTRPETAADSLTSSVDQVLEKISASGMESLTEEERGILRAASERLKNRPGREG